MERRKGLAEELLERGVRLAIEAAEKVLGDPRGRDAVALASELAQTALKKLEELQGAAVKAAGVPSREEHQRLAEQVARIQRKAQDLAARLDAMDRGARREPAAGAAAPKPRWRDPEDPEAR
jgi:hypothetical protein